jgi:hypothetical protein
LFLDLARASTQDPELISVVSENLRYTSSSVTKNSSSWLKAEVGFNRLKKFNPFQRV